MSAKSKQRLAIGTHVHLVCDPAWSGEVIGHDKGVVLVSFRVGLQIATGRHSPAALMVMK